MSADEARARAEKLAREIATGIGGHDEDKCGRSGWDLKAECTCPPDESFEIALRGLLAFAQDERTDEREACAKIAQEDSAIYAMIRACHCLTIRAWRSLP